MKIISLNVDRGANRTDLLEFLSAKRHEIDIFCFQEVINGGGKELQTFWTDEKKKTWNLLELMQKALPDYVSFFHPHIGDWSGLAIFVRKEISVIREGDVFVFGNSRIYPDSPLLCKPPAPRNLQYIEILSAERKLTVLNFHGMWDKSGKGDSDARVAQSQKIIDFARNCMGELVLSGDFNLLPETKSIHMLEKELRLRNLVREYGITSTRTSFFTGAEKFADYVFVTPGITVHDFQVLEDIVSDHAPLYLEFSEAFDRLTKSS